MAGFLERFHAFEKDYSGLEYLDWHRENADIPILAIALYVAFVFGVPKLLGKPTTNLKPLLAVWNVLLCSFSIMGASRVVPFLYEQVRDNGFKYTICEKAVDWYAHGPAALWMCLFIYSKFPELGDTVFLVFRKKPVIFLHWFHHVTVLLYCWHSYHMRIACGLWFAAMNYSVHSVMYFYYFMTNIGYYKLMRPFAPFITLVQILQMVGGVTVLVSVYRMPEGEACHNDKANVRLGLAMYMSYFILFCVLFYHKYFVAAKNPTIQTLGCVPDIKNVDTIFSSTVTGAKKEKGGKKQS